MNDPHLAHAAADHSPGWTLLPPRVRLFALGCLTLLLELILIRYLAGNIWNLGYFPNLVLLAVFVGMGLGFILHGRVPDAASPRVLTLASGLLLALVGLVLAARPTVPGFGSFEGSVGGELFFTATPALRASGGIGIFAAWFGLTVLVFAAIAQRTAKLFRLFPPLTAYTLDIAGSVTGILVFMAASALELPAWSWFLLLTPLFLIVSDDPSPRLRLVPLGGLYLVVGIAWIQDTPAARGIAAGIESTVRWSPYQKVEFLREPGAPGSVRVNGIGHQAIVHEKHLGESFYMIPYASRHQAGLPSPAHVLVIGAGTGNDVVAALAAGAARVDAVEIDPAIARLGRLHHPLGPYLDPRVRVIVDDGRAVLSRSRDRYDVIVFALTDSLVKVSSMAQLRLENYLFTEESLRSAAAHLAPSGDLVLYNFYRRPWLVEKLSAMMERSVGSSTVRVPLLKGDFHVLMARRSADAASAGALGAAAVAAPEPARDDWPFPYLERRGIPSLYASAIALAAALVVLLVWLVRRSDRGTKATSLPLSGAFACMGAAFLLLETKSVVQFSLLFGTTWINASLVFLAVLLLVLAANHAASFLRGSRSLPVVAALLLASCLATLVWPVSGLTGVEDRAARFVLASLMTFTPIFFANLLFSLSFRDAAVPERLFGWNLVGATVGGLAEYASMAVGYTALAGLVAILYLAAIVLLFAGRRPAASAG